MARKTETVTKMICDRCGTKGVEGEGVFKSTGMSGSYHIWGRSYDGSTGGAKSSFDFCSKCTLEFQDWLAKKNKIV